MIDGLPRVIGVAKQHISKYRLLSNRVNLRLDGK